MMRLIFYTFVICTVLALTFSGLSANWLISLLIGYFIWNCFEYGFHRFIFHHRGSSKNILSYNHALHHKNPVSTEDLFLPVTLTLPISLICFFISLIIAGQQLAGGFYTGLLLGYFIYEFMHYQAHHGNMNNKFNRWMRAYHLQHHRKTPRKHYMVSNPLLDYLLRTE